MYVNTHLWQDPSPEAAAKRRAIDQLVVLLRSVIEAQQKIMLEFNVEKDRLEDVCR
jgi:ATP phosphoribosyltransferase